MRKPRRIIVGATYHVVARANRREYILHSDIMKQLFLETLTRAKQRYRFSVTNVCLMGNHFHLIMTPARDESISRIMQWILSVFAVRYNRKHGFQGHVWYDRFKSKAITSLRQFAATFAYVCNNPVRAGIASHPADYRFGGPALLCSGPPGAVDTPGLLVNLLFPWFSVARLPR
ncbi:MAG: transposase [Spirochaetaceae bacterium]|nr:MAG: transposase [Spirochaetaceae bacterium]